MDLGKLISQGESEAVEFKESLQLKDEIGESVSSPRNPLIARQFFWIRFIEEVGTGTNDMIRYCKEWEIPEPEFKHITGDFVVTFRGTITEEYLTSLGLNERQIEAIGYIREKGKITNKEFRKVSPEISEETARLDLNELVRKKILNKKGKNKGVFYEFK